MADDAINWMSRIHKTDPEHPVCLHDVSGSPHALDHSMHLFDDGDEKLRGRSFENLKRLAVIRPDEELPPRPAEWAGPETGLA